MSDEAHLSAEQSRAQTSSRFPRPHGNGSRPQDSARPSCPRPQVAERLSQLQAPAPQEKDRAIVTISTRADFLAANKGRRMAMAGFVLLVHARRAGGPNQLIEDGKASGRDSVCPYGEIEVVAG